MKNSILSTNVSNLSEDERFELLWQLPMDKAVFNYIESRLQNLTIEIGDGVFGNPIDLMIRGKLMGWCWQTTESAIVFFENNDCIERGYLTFGNRKEYWHSWMVIKFNYKYWVFDPCLRILVEKDVYYHVFEIAEVAGTVTAKDVRNELIYRIQQNTPKSFSPPSSFSMMSLMYKVLNKYRNETHIDGDNDVKTNMYRNNTGYTATISMGRIKTLIAHYYYDG